MKHIIFFSTIFFFSFQTLNAQTGGMTSKFKVYGNCSMCEKRIEKAAKIKGVTFADWDVDSKMLTIHFDEKKVTPGKVQHALAAVGHDTDKVRASDKAYAKLHTCCQYERAGN